MPDTTSFPAEAIQGRFSTSQIRCAAQPAAAGGDEPGSLSYYLLLVFVLLVYSNVGVLYPAVEIARPALVIGGLGLMALVWERLNAGSLELAWPDSYLFFAFIGAAGISIFGALWQGYAAEATSSLVKMAVAYLLILNSVNSERRLRGLMWLMFLCGLFPALGTLHNWHIGHLEEGRATWVGFFGNPNEMAYGLVILIPLGVVLSNELGWLRRIAVWVVMALFAAAIYLSYSRGSLIGLFAVGAYLGWRQQRTSARIAVLAVLIASAIAVPVYWSRGEGFTGLSQDSSFQQRLETYRVALAMFQDHPVVGVGINCSAVAWPLYAPHNLGYHTWLITHNTFLQALSETGVLGFATFFSFLGAVIYRAWRLSRVKLSPGQSEALPRLVGALEISVWGFVLCGLSGGYVMSWFPYLLAGMVGAGGNLVDRQMETAYK